MATIPNTHLPTEFKEPRTLIAAKIVDLALITYADEGGVQKTTVALVGDNKVHLINARTLGISRESSPEGIASNWLADAVLVKLGKKDPSEKKEG